jgi:hypothetical protein
MLWSQAGGTWSTSNSGVVFRFMENRDEVRSQAARNMVQAIWLFNLALLVYARQSLGFTSPCGYVGAKLGLVKQGPSKSRHHPRTAPHLSKHPAE